MLLGAALAAASAGLLTSLAALLTADSTAVRGALIGSALAITVYVAGAFAVDAVARVLPSAALLIALLTYTLQVLAMGLVFWSLTSSGALETSVDARWIGGAVVAVTLAWLMVQVSLTMKARIPVYDLAPASPTQPAGRGA